MYPTMNMQLSSQEEYERGLAALKAKLYGRFENMESDMNKVKDELIETFDSMNQEIEELEGQIKTNETTIKQLNENLDKKDEEILRLKSTIKDLRSGVSKSGTGPIKATDVTNHKDQ